MASYSELPLAEGGKPSLAAPSRARSTVQTGMYMVLWIVSSNFTILFNKWLIDTAGFSYPIILTCWHLVFAAIVTQILARTTTLLDSRHSLPINGRFYIRTVLPIGFVASVSLICSNMVYMYLNVAFIQMLKASSPAAVLFISWALGVAKPGLGSVVNILVIVFGVALASAGEIEMSMVGVAIQLGGIVFEATRVVLIQVMLGNEGFKMDPLVGLYYYAPACAALNFVVALAVEVPRFKFEDLARVGWLMLFLNAAVAFLLNFASMVLIGKTSSLVTTLTGIFKNILLILSSVLLWNTQIAPIQIVGYGIGLAGLVYYSFGWEKMVAGYHCTKSWAGGLLEHPGSGKSNISPKVRVGVYLAAALMFSMCLVGGYYQGVGKSIATYVWST